MQSRRRRRRSAARTSARPSRACSASRSTCATRARCATRSTSCAQLPIVTERGAQIRLGDVADDRASPTARRCCKSENARLSGWVYVDIRGRDLRSAVARHAARGRASRCKLPPGYSISWSGQFEYLERATAQLKLVVPFTLLIIFVLLYLTFRRFDEALLIMATLPFALVGGFWLLWLLGHNLSVASAVGFIALAGVAAEFGVIMLLYLKHALGRARRGGRRPSDADLLDAIREGAVLRVRPEGDDGGGDHRRPVARSCGAAAPARRSCSASRRRWSAA